MRRLVTVIVLAVSPLFWACSEEDVTPPALDRTAPEVRILYPFDAGPNAFAVYDSVDVYLVAHDVGVDGREGAVARVEVWFTHSRTPEPVQVGTMTEPIPIEQVPAHLRTYIDVPAGWSLYTRRWYTGTRYPPPISTPIGNAGVQLFALAYDATGNLGQSDEMVRVQTHSCDCPLFWLEPQFTIHPSSGSTATVFTFDPRATTDPIDPNQAVRVRWDFDGNSENGWNIDWDQDARAHELQTFRFATPGIYRIVLQAHTSYLPDSIAVRTRDLAVYPLGDGPPPPEPDNYVEVPAGTYVMGDSSFVWEGASYPCDESEGPVHAAVMYPYRIEKTEVTNRLYLSFLLEALAAQPPAIVLRDGAILAAAPDDTLGAATVYLVLARSAIFYDLDREMLAIRPGQDEHPVTGVTWFGATAYASHYGLRLPTEAEWEVAARGDHESYNYPFVDGVELTSSDGPQRANYAGARSGGDPFVGTTTPRRFFDGQVHQGFRTIDSPSVFGLYDLAGNVSEWVSDWYGPYPWAQVFDPQGPASGAYKVVRGGTYSSSRVGIRCTARQGLPPNDGYATTGFRTAF